MCSDVTEHFLRKHLNNLSHKLFKGTIQCGGNDTNIASAIFCIKSNIDSSLTLNTLMYFNNCSSEILILVILQKEIIYYIYNIHISVLHHKHLLMMSSSEQILIEYNSQNSRSKNSIHFLLKVIFNKN